MKMATNLFFHGIICLGFLHPTPSSSTALPASHPPRLLPPLFSLLSMASPTKIHPATLVTNIKTSMPIQLDEQGTNIHTWVTLFKRHCRAHLVDAHILPNDSFKASAFKDSEWQRLDDIVHTWIFGTLSPSLLLSIIRPGDCSFDAWTRIENNFQNNKTSRILHLESQFNEISLSNFPNVKTYCNELETIATSLTNLGTSISDNQSAL